mgnify:CR=1 FL=1
MLVVLFWSCLAVIAYVHLGYPLLMALLALIKKQQTLSPFKEWPTISLIIAAYNEERVLAAKLVNSLTIDYPRERLEIIVASDGSTDATDQIASRFAAQGVRLLRLEGRQGKTAVQNAAAAEASGEILVFSDANALFDPDALRRLVAGFADPTVGCVEGRRVDFAATTSATVRTELTYRDWESKIKVWESRVLSCVGATGPIYAVRRSLYVPLNPAVISDFMEPLLIMCRHGKRQVFEPAAISREAVQDKMRDEFCRKVRIMTRCLNSLKKTPQVLNPFQNGWFALQVWSHRLLRWLVPVFALIGLTANILLLSHPFYRLSLLLAMVFLLMGAIGALLEHFRLGATILRLPHYFCAANLAALAALSNCLRGKTIAAWQTERP